jgi:hypothetical protein
MSEEAERSSAPIIEGFKGLNNRIDPTRLGLTWQLEAGNVLCDDAGYLVRRPGWVEAALDIKDVHAARDGRLLAITAADALVEILADGATNTLATDLAGGPFQWVELGYALFLLSPTAKWAVYPDRVLTWGALCPTSDPTAYPLGDPLYYLPPDGALLAAYGDRIALGAVEPALDRSVVYFSRPGYPHEFCLERDFFMVPGRLTLLAEAQEELIVGTDRAIYLDAPEAPLRKVADYGALPCGSALDDRGKTYFWTERGLCRAPPFENVTDEALVPTLRRAGTVGLLPFQGGMYAVAHQHGALRDRSRAAPHAPPALVESRLQGVVLD